MNDNCSNTDLEMVFKAYALPVFCLEKDANQKR